MKKGKVIEMNTITVEKRNSNAKAKQLRRAGIIPCVVYGGNLQESLSIQISQHTANKLFRLYREGSKVQLQVEDQLIPVQIKDKSQDPLTNAIIHISFEALQANQRVNSIAHILLENTDKVTGILEKMLLEIPYSSLPDHMIDTVSIDLDGMAVGTVLTIEDIPAFKDENVDLQVDKNSIVLRIPDRKRASSEAIA